MPSGGDLNDRARAALANGDPAAAARAFRAAICSDPERPRGYFNLGLLLARSGRAADAERAYGLALVLEPGHEGAAGNLADLLMSADRIAEAEQRCADAVRWSPLSGLINANLGLLRIRLGKADAAARDLRRSLCAEPGYASAWHTVAMRCHDESAQADAAYKRAWCSGMCEARVLTNRGEIAQRDGRIDEAIELHGQALRMAPGNPDILANLATAGIDNGDFGAARRYAEAALALDPEHRVARWIRNWVALAHRDFETGFRGYDETWQSPERDADPRATAHPLWDGSALAGGLLLWCEHGLGDEILYAGMIDDVLARGVRVVLETDRRLVPLFERTWPAARIMARGDPAPGDIAAQSSLLRLPMLFRRHLGAFPPRNGYLRPDPDKVAGYRERFGTGGGETVIGLSWRSGNRRTGAGKSTRLDQWEALLALSGIRFVSLQYDDGGETDPRVLANPGDPRNDIDDLAAQIAALDHVVSISGVTAHLAGAVGTPGHVLLPPAPLWFWFAEGEDCPWYPSLTLCRRRQGEDWAPAVARTAAAVRSRLGR